MIFHVTYLSEGLKVKGYIALPNDIDFSINQLKEEWRMLYSEHDELSIEQISYSVVAKKKPMLQLPALIYCRGGIGNYGRVKTDWLEQFASYGFFVFAPSYRGSEGGEGKDEFGGQDVADVVAAYELVSSLPFVKKQQISLLGFSRGAINATKAAIKIPFISSIILWGGVADLTRTYEERIDLRKMLKRAIGGTPSRVPSQYEMRSPVTFVHKIHCPVLLMHGTEDTQVDYRHALFMYRTLLHASKKVELHTYERYGHHLPLNIHLQAIDAMFRWMMA